MDIRTATRRALLAAALLAGPMALTACDDDGPAEEAGEAIDESAERAGEALEDAGETIQQNAQ
jgi:hypothetical protein